MNRVIRVSRVPSHKRELFEEEAKAMGYFPFVRLSPLDALTLREIHGRWIFDELLIHLDDPLRIHRDWAIAFCAAAAKIPREQLRNPETIYGVVKSHPTFRDRRSAIREFRRVYFGKIWKRAKDPGARFASLWERRLVRADYERVKCLIALQAKEKNDAIVLNNQRLASVPNFPETKNDAHKSGNVIKPKAMVTF